MLLRSKLVGLSLIRRDWNLRRCLKWERRRLFRRRRVD